MEAVDGPMPVVLYGGGMGMLSHRPLDTSLGKLEVKIDDLQMAELTRASSEGAAPFPKEVLDLYKQRLDLEQQRLKVFEGLKNTPPTP